MRWEFFIAELLSRKDNDSETDTLVELKIFSKLYFLFLNIMNIPRQDNVGHYIFLVGKILQNWSTMQLLKFKFSRKTIEKIEKNFLASRHWRLGVVLNS